MKVDMLLNKDKNSFIIEKLKNYKFYASFVIQ